MHVELGFGFRYVHLFTRASGLSKTCTINLEDGGPMGSGPLLVLKGVGPLRLLQTSSHRDGPHELWQVNMKIGACFFDDLKSSLLSSFFRSFLELGIAPGADIGNL